ncbi:MAG: hypothetical protein OXR73_01355 [Myxococcales bacterium]|nr:hypothetical protein [Myxococcales bacterium]
MTEWRWEHERPQLLEEEGIEWDDSDPKRPEGRAGILWDPRLVNPMERRLEVARAAREPWRTSESFS